MDRRVDATAWVHPSAQLYGNIRIAADASVWPNAVMRAECQHIAVGRMTNIQDFVMVHVGFDHPTSIGEFCSITHHATVHGATVEDCCLIGINATLMDGVVVGRGSIVAGGAVCKEGSVFPPGSVIAGTPATVIRERDSSRANRLNAWIYQRNAQFYRQGRHDAWAGPEFTTWRGNLWERIQRDEDLFQEILRREEHHP